MGFFSMFKRSVPGGRRANRAAAPLDSASVEALRSRVRQRFIGAAVLVIAAVLLLPLVFETQPRPLPSSVEIRMPNADVEGAVAPGRPRFPAPDALPVDAPVTPAPAVAPPASPSVSASTVRPATTTSAKGELQPPLPALRPPGASAPAVSRYLIQVGAYADAAGALQVRQRLEQLGLRATLQEVETNAGRRTRVRLGPYSTRDEADKVAARVRAAGLGVALLSL